MGLYGFIASSQLKCRGLSKDSRETKIISFYDQHPESKEKETPTAEEVSSTLDKILENYDHRLRPNISEGPLIIQSDVFITGQ